MTFFFCTESGDALVAVAGGEPFRAHLGGDESRFREVEHCSLRFQSSKTISFTHTLARRSECEAAVLEDLCLWVARSGVKGKDELTIRYPLAGDHVHSRKVLTAKEYGSIMSWLATQESLPVSTFSSKNARIGYTTTGVLDGLSREEINEGGGWVKGSNVPARSYINRKITHAKLPVEARSGKPLGALARTGVAGASTLTIDQVRTLSSAREVAAKSLAPQSL